MSIANIAAVKQYYTEIELRLNDAQRYLTLVKMEYYTVLRNALEMPKYAEEIMTRYANLMASIESKIDALETKLPCQPFINKFGLEGHEQYKEKYPINHKTQIDEVYAEGRPELYIPQHEPIVFRADGVVPPTIEFHYIIAKFERWGWSNDEGAIRIHSLAYIPETNTILIDKSVGWIYVDMYKEKGATE